MRTFLKFSNILLLGLTALSSCSVYDPTPTPDYRIKVMQTPEGMVAIPPTCPGYAEAVKDPYDNQPMPQFGCASARNLALMADRPSDIVKPRDLGPTSGYPMVGSVMRYNNGQTRGLIYPSASTDTAVDVTTSSSATSSISGDITGGLSGQSTSSSSSSSSSTTSGAVPSGAAGGAQ